MPERPKPFSPNDVFPGRTGAGTSNGLTLHRATLDSRRDRILRDTDADDRIPKYALDLPPRMLHPLIRLLLPFQLSMENHANRGPDPVDLATAQRLALPHIMEGIHVF
jgi:hypothetical protein